jgi:hypothetical protein
MTKDPSHTTFVELTAADAEQTLLGLAVQLEQLEEVSNCHLLKSSEQQDLWLLLCQSSSRLELELPKQARLWRFERP